MNKVEIIETKKDIFHLNADVLFNPVNTKGVMGKGLAAQFKKRYPSHFVKYRDLCYSKKLKAGQPELVKDKTGQFIMLFPTKTHWQYKSKIEYIEKGLIYVKDNYNLGESIALPMLGCGLGGLEWADVKDLIYKYCPDMEVRRVYVCVWDGTYGKKK